MAEIIKPATALWLAVSLVGIVVYVAVPSHEDNPPVVALTRNIGLFVASLTFFVGKRTRRGEGRTLAFLYSAFFSVHVLFGLTASFGSAGLIGPQKVFQLVQYENLLHSGALLVVCAYVVGGTVFLETKQKSRLILALIVAGALIGPASLSLVTNPNYLYTLPDITDFRAIDRAVAGLRAEGIVTPGPGDVAERVSLSRWQELKRTGELGHMEELARIGELFPFLEGDNYIVLVSRPLYERYTLWSMACIVLLMGFFVLNFLRDPPKPAHFEKIHFTLLIYAVFEYFHASTLASATSFDELVALDMIGKYLTAAILIFFALLFLVRARFLCMSVGEFYEDRLMINPEGISRWRDGVDNFFLRALLMNPKMRSRFLSRFAEKK